MKKNLFLFFFVWIFLIFYTNRLNSMPRTTKSVQAQPKMSSQGRKPTQQAALMPTKPIQPPPIQTMQTMPMSDTAQAPITASEPSEEEPTSQLSETPIPSSNEQESDVKESQLGWPESIELEKTKPLVKKENKEIVRLFDEAKKLYQDTQIILRNIQSIKNNFFKNFAENFEKMDLLLKETTYKKGVIIENLIESHNNAHDKTH